jgi:hypothetical protein
MSFNRPQSPSTPLAVEVGGVVHLGHYSIRNGMIRVTYGSSGKPTQLGGMSRTPQLLARLMLAEMVREHQGTVRGI